MFLSNNRHNKEFKRPLCNRCKRPIDEVWVSEFDITAQHIANYQITISCHGQHEYFDLRDFSVDEEILINHLGTIFQHTSFFPETVVYREEVTPKFDLIKWCEHET